MIQTNVVGVEEVVSLLEDLPEHLFDSAKRAMQKATLSAQANITIPMATGVNGLQSRTSNLAKSIKTSVTGTKLETLNARLFTDSIYAPIHEKGGTITAQKAYAGLAGGPFLNIPSSDNKTPAGITRKTASTVFAEGGYIVRISSPKARYMVVLDGTPMFWLVKSVQIQARLKMIQTAEDEIPTLLSELNSILLEDI